LKRSPAGKKPRSLPADYAVMPAEIAKGDFGRIIKGAVQALEP
jgi:hypothetical protein